MKTILLSDKVGIVFKLCQLLFDLIEGGASVGVQVPGLLHEVVDLSWATFRFLHPVTLFYMLYHIRQRLQVKEKTNQSRRESNRQ